MVRRVIEISIDVPEIGDACWTSAEGGAHQCFVDVILTPAKRALNRQLALCSNAQLTAYLEKQQLIQESVQIKEISHG